jgi:hypothetical protein
VLLTFVIKEVLRDSLKDLHDSVAQAEAQFRTESGQSGFSVQALLDQQQRQILRLQDDKRRDDPLQKPTRAHCSGRGSEKIAWAKVYADFDAVSRLIDKLPSGTTDIRKLRTEVQASIGTTKEQANSILNTKTSDDVSRFAVAKTSILFACTQEIAIIILGDVALKRAQQVEEATEYLIRCCTRATWVLGIFALMLGLYAAVTGMKSDAAE